MEESVSMNIGHSLHNLEHHSPNFVLRERSLALPPLPNQLIEVHVEQLEDHAELVVISENLPQLHYIGVNELDEGAHLREGHRLLP